MSKPVFIRVATKADQDRAELVAKAFAKVHGIAPCHNGTYWSAVNDAMINGEQRRQWKTILGCALGGEDYSFYYGEIVRWEN